MRILDLHEQFCQYCLAIKNYRHSTIHNYKGAIKLLVKQSGIENIEEMTENILRNFFFVGRTERNWTSITFIDYRKSMMGFFKWCVKQKIIATNPLENIEKPKLEKRLPKNLCIESARRLLEVTLNYPYTHDFIRYRNYAVIATFVYSGLRANELLKLHLTDVDFQNKLITVRQGKGAKDRMVPMLTDLEIILQKYLSQRQSIGGFDLQNFPNTLSLPHAAPYLCYAYVARRLRYFQFVQNDGTFGYKNYDYLFRRRYWAFEKRNTKASFTKSHDAKLTKLSTL